MVAVCGQVAAQTNSDRKVEADRLFTQGNLLDDVSKYREAIAAWEQALQIYREIKDRKGEADSLGNLGNAYYSLRQIPKAIDFFSQARIIQREIAHRWDEFEYFVSRGNISYDYLGEISFGEKRLVTASAIGDRESEARYLNHLGNGYQSLGQYQKAIASYHHSLTIAREIGEYKSQMYALGNLGNSYNALGQFQKAIELYQQSLAIKRSIGDYKDADEGIFLNNLGNAYYSLGQYQKAIDLYQRSFVIMHEITDLGGQINSLNNLGLSYAALRQYQHALEFHQQALTIARDSEFLLGKARSLNNLGNVYQSLGQYQKAIEFYQQSFTIKRDSEDLQGQANSLNNMGNAYNSLEQYQKAIDYYQQAFVISKQIGDRNGEGSSLNNLGALFAKLNQSELAILFYKQSVNIRETIRKDIRGLSEEEQKSYLGTIEGSYRRLADLLLKEDRILEAQQVLDLLKVQELSEYFRSAVNDSAKKADYQLPEKNIIAFGIELDQLQKLDPLTKEQEQRLAYLTNQESNRNEQFNTFLQSPAVQKQIEQLRRDKAKNVDLEEYNRLRESLKEIKNAAIFYPLILDDRLELILITDTNTPIRKTININREALNKDISDFLISLRNPSSNAVQADAQKFYKYLIEPFEKELQDAKIETIIYAPDGQLRYIPLAALYDGKQWLIERYRINNITASSLTNLRPRIHKPLRVLAAAATISQNIKFGDTSIPFGALPATKTEVEAIATLLPRTTTLIDGQFNKTDTLPKMQSNSIIHLATHGYFAIGKPEDSFIVFGDGDKATIADMKKWTLTNVELVVLSACETAIGGKVGSGIEIFGLGYQIHNAGAGAAIASLWKVSDGGTQKLMDAFYTALKTGKVSNVEALRQAQVAMITGNSEGLGEPRGQISVEVRSRNTSTVPPKISHPYYWAAFILIGNGL